MTQRGDEVMTAYRVLEPALRGTEEWAGFVVHVNEELRLADDPRRIGGGKT